jgi:eukaryotic-like serine/threonine-protein kinase
MLLKTALGVGMKERLLREAQSATRLNHPNIVTVFVAGEAEAVAFIVLELVPGETLRQCTP